MRRDQPTNPGAQGFDDWVSSPNFFDLDPILSDKGAARAFQGDSSDVTADLAIRFIKDCAEKEQRFVAVVWFGSPHNPHQALEADRELYNDQPKNLRGFYGEITAMDRAFGRLRDTLRELGLRQNTLLWYCSDNGALPKVGSAGSRRGSKGSIYEGGLAVPALLEWPAKFPDPKVFSEPCVTSDILPTLLDVAGLDPDKSRPLDGISLMPLLEGAQKHRTQPIGFWDASIKGIGTPAKQWMEEQMAAEKEGREPSPEPPAFAAAARIQPRFTPGKFPGHAAWLDGSWKLHRIEDPKTGNVNWELYDLAADPDESRVLLAEQPERVAQMQEALENWLESVVRSHDGKDYPPSP